MLGDIFPVNNSNYTLIDYAFPHAVDKNLVSATSGHIQDSECGKQDDENKVPIQVSCAHFNCLILLCSRGNTMH